MRRIWTLALASAAWFTAASAAFAQGGLGFGEVDRAGDGGVVVTGESDVYGQSGPMLLEMTDAAGLPEVALIEFAEDGGFTLYGDDALAAAPFSLVEGLLVDPFTGATANSMTVVVAADPEEVTTFRDWFDNYDINCNGIDERNLPNKRPPLYRFEWLEEKDRWKDTPMGPNDYFPNWPDKDDGTPTYDEDTNLDFIRDLVKDGKPVKDVYVDGDGELIDRNKKYKDEKDKPTIQKERDVLENGGFEFDKDKGHWEVPDGYVWDDDAKKWVPGS